MKEKLKAISFASFIEYFPEVELPIILTEESIHNFSKLNTPLPISAYSFFIKEDVDIPDEFTEYIPCLRFTPGENVAVILLWKGGLLSYDYLMISYNIKKQEEINRKIIAGTKILEGTIIKSSAVISTDFEVDILVNSYSSEKQMYPERSEQFVVEIMMDGTMTTVHET